MPYDLPRIPLPTSASSAEMDRLPSAIRRQALWSARLNLVGPVVTIGEKVKGILDGKLSESEARRDIRAALDAAGYQPPADAVGGLRDHRSRTRLDLILGQQVRAARNFAWRASGMRPDALYLYPADELVRIMSRKNPRGTWQARWREAGGRLFDGGRMIALKTSPVWVNLSRFGQPYPPFDYGSGMGVIDIARDEAVRLGVLGEEDEQTPEPAPFPEVSEANLPGIDAMPGLQAAILKVFGEGARFDGGVLSMRPAMQLPVSGDAVAMGMGPLRDRTVETPPPLVTPAEASSLIAARQAVAKDPSGRAVRFDDEIVAHWRRKGYSRKSIDARLRHLRQALAGVHAPQEVWERGGTRWYLREFQPGADGRHASVLVQVGTDDRVMTWIPASSRPRYLERKRTGALLIKEGAP